MIALAQRSKFSSIEVLKAFVNIKLYFIYIIEVFMIEFITMLIEIIGLAFDIYTYNEQLNKQRPKKKKRKK